MQNLTPLFCISRSKSFRGAGPSSIAIPSFISTTVTFLNKDARWFAVSAPTKPPPITTHLSPVFTFPSNTSWLITTFLFSTMPGIFLGIIGTTPVAAITTSGLSRKTISFVTSVCKTTGTFSFFSSCICQHKNAVISPFPGGIDAILYCPPAHFSLS